MTIKVLVLDDEAAWREILGEIFNTEGYLVDTAENLEQARLCLHNNRYNLAVLDMVLSGDVIVEGTPTGLELLLDIYRFNDDRHDQCGFVVLTGNAKYVEVRKFLEANLPNHRRLEIPVVLKRGHDGKGFAVKEFVEVCMRVMSLDVDY